MFRLFPWRIEIDFEGDFRVFVESDEGIRWAILNGVVRVDHEDVLLI